MPDHIIYPSGSYEESFAVFDYTLEGNYLHRWQKNNHRPDYRHKNKLKQGFRAYNMGKLIRIDPAPVRSK